eukprot:765596-Hanusia_phi.AAC.2
MLEQRIALVEYLPIIKLLFASPSCAYDSRFCNELCLGDQALHRKNEHNPTTAPVSILWDHDVHRNHLLCPGKDFPTSASANLQSDISNTLSSPAFREAP